MKFPRLYVSSWIVFCGVLLLGIVINCGGDYSDENGELNFGRPWRYGGIGGDIRESLLRAQADERSFARTNEHPWIWWRCYRVERLSWIAVTANAAVVLLAAVGVAVVWESRQRRRKRWLQFTLADILTAIAVFATLFGIGQREFHDALVERKLKNTLSAELSPESFSDAAYFGPCYPGMESPCDWFWETLRIPYEYRPYRRTSSVLAYNSKLSGRLSRDLYSPYLPTGATDFIAQLRSQRELWISGFQLKSDDVRKIATLPHLQKVTLCDMKLDGEMQAALAKSPQLLEVELRSCDVSDDHLAALAECPTLKVLHLHKLPRDKFEGHRLSAFRSVSHLVLESVVLDDQAAEEIAAMPRLENLSLHLEYGLTESSRNRLIPFLFPEDQLEHRQ